MSIAARLSTAVADRYAIEGQSGVGRLTTAKAAARLSVAESDIRRRQFTDRLPSREFTRGTARSATGVAVTTDADGNLFVADRHYLEISGAGQPPRP